MSLVINTNTAASTAARNLNHSHSMLQKSLARLSSGSRITAPADDAGGLAVSMKMEAAIRRTDAASSNVANAVSFLQTQDGSMKSAGKVLERIAELKTLSTDVTKSASDIANYDTEFTALKAELTNQTTSKFNGVDLFGGGTLTVETSKVLLALVRTGPPSIANCAFFPRESVAPPPRPSDSSNPPGLSLIATPTSPVVLFVREKRSLTRSKLAVTPAFEALMRATMFCTLSLFTL